MYGAVEGRLRGFRPEARVRHRGARAHELAGQVRFGCSFHLLVAEVREHELGIAKEDSIVRRDGLVDEAEGPAADPELAHTITEVRRIAGLTHFLSDLGPARLLGPCRLGGVEVVESTARVSRLHDVDV